MLQELKPTHLTPELPISSTNGYTMHGKLISEMIELHSSENSNNIMAITKHII